MLLCCSGGKLKCTTFSLHDFKGALMFSLVNPLKLACKRHPAESEIGLTLQRGASKEEGREGGREGVYLWFIFFAVIGSIKELKDL